MGLIFYLKVFRNVLEYENLRNNLLHIVQRKGVSVGTQHLIQKIDHGYITLKIDMSYLPT
jgi:hypothetical protein